MERINKHKRYRSRKRLDALEAAFAALPSAHKTPAVYLFGAKLGGIPDAVATERVGLAISLFEGVKAGAK
jgi:orotate phosphoribosyltransferase